MSSSTSPASQSPFSAPSSQEQTVGLINADVLQRLGITQNGTQYSKTVKMNEKDVTITLNYTAEVTKEGQLTRDMDITIKTMKEAAKVLNLGGDQGPSRLSIKRGEELKAFYGDSDTAGRFAIGTIKQPERQEEQYQYAEMTKVIDNVKTIFGQIISAPAVASPSTSSPSSVGSPSVAVNSDESSVEPPVLQSSSATASTPAAVESTMSSAAAVYVPSIAQTEEGKSVETVINELRQLSLVQHQDQLIHYREMAAELDDILNKCQPEGVIDFDQLSKKMELFNAVKLEIEHDFQTEMFDPEVQKQYEKLVDALRNLQKAHNKAADGPEKLQLEQDINSLNGMMAAMNLSTSKQKAVEGKVMMFGAVVERKMEIIKKLLEKGSERAPEGEIQPREEGKRIRKEIDKLTNEFINETTSNEVLIEIGESIIGELEGLKAFPHEILSPKDAKAANKYPKELECGRAHLNEALTSAMNWTPIRSAAILFSSSGRAYTSETILMPLGLDENGRGVPAGLRDPELDPKKYSKEEQKAYRERYNARPTNLFATTHIIHGDNEEISRETSFRGGQFPTKASARAALEEILGSSRVDALHINSLLTPVMIESGPLGKPDRTLLADHKKHIQEAWLELVNGKLNECGPHPGDEVTIGTVKYSRAELTRLSTNVPMLSNLGVNEGAVGQLAGLKLGWHTSLRDYSNEAAANFNETLTVRLNELKAVESDDLPMINRLGALVHVGLEMEEIWARNDFAEATKGNDQFKMAAYWKVMDMLLGNTSYANCMSGKDRTGEVESAAQFMYSEIMMKLADHKQEVQKIVNGEDSKLSEKQRKLIIKISGAITEKEAKDLVSNDQTDEQINRFIEGKIVVAKTSLNNGNLLQEKDINVLGPVLPGTLGISTTIPLRKKDDNLINKFYVPGFPPMAPISYYQKTDDITPEMRQLAAVNRRKHMFASMQVTLLNTGKGGFKLDPHKYLARMESGFDRKYVVAQLMGTDVKTINKDKYIDLLGLHEIDTSAQERFLQELADVKGSKLNTKGKEKAFKAVLKKVETYKAESFHPQAKVKA